MKLEIEKAILKLYASLKFEYKDTNICCITPQLYGYIFELFYASTVLAGTASILKLLTTYICRWTGIRFTNVLTLWNWIELC
jgi:hypothetical protein